MSDNWKNKILNHQETPPAGVWESIAGRLDQDKWQQRVLSHEETPPAGVWANIVAGLEAEKDHPVIPVQKKGNTVIIWRIAAAACIVSFIIVSVFLLNKNTGSTLPAQEVAQKTEVKKEEAFTPAGKGSTTDSQIAVPPNKPVARVTEQQINAVKKYADEKPSAEVADLNINYSNGNEVVENLARDPSKITSEKLTNTEGQAVNDIARMEPPNSYVTITGPDGETIKVSSKFSKMINAITDRKPDSEEYIDKVIKESKFWKGKFKSWRDKMINNTFAPTPTNFMDVIELSRLVKE